MRRAVQSLRGGAERLARARLTILALALLAAGVAGIYAFDLPPTWLLAVPAGLLAVNLAAALAVTPALRRSPGLLVFHVALLAFLALLVTGRLTYLRGQVEVTEGTTFTGNMNAYVAGPLHPWRLEDATFHQGAFEIRYRSDGSRGDIESRVTWMDRRGRVHEATASEREPLVRAGYRFAPTANKGFAAVFRWRPNGGAAATGSIHFPSFPANADRQSLDWALPAGGPEVWTELKMEQPPLVDDAAGWFRLPDEHRVVLRRGTERWELEPGDGAAFAGGELRYMGLRTWMGYTVFYDATVPWLLAAAVVGCLGLGGHYALAPAGARAHKGAS